MQSGDPLRVRGFRRLDVRQIVPAPDPRGEQDAMRVPLEHYPGMNRFVLDWMGGDERFLPRSREELASGFRLPGSTTARTPDARSHLSAALDASNRHWGIFAKDQLQRWAAGDTFTIIG